LTGDTYRSDHIIIRNSTVINGDDCVSFKPNTTFTTVENMYCDGSHGISVGSLGQYYGVPDIVSDVYVRNVTCINCEHGARIKVFPGHNDTQSVEGGGTGEVRNSECRPRALVGNGTTFRPLTSFSSAHSHLGGL
jgi:galacturan 1,4-alpha-galacturonidase